MFYDVLLKLCFQSIKIHFLGKELLSVQILLDLMKRFGGRPFYSDHLEALQWKNPLEQTEFDECLIGLN